MDKWRIERIAESHERGQFQSGHVSLDNFLQTLAVQYERRRLGATFVAVSGEEWRVAGYYTLVANSVSPAVLPKKIARRFPKHSVPVVLLGRLAVDCSHQGKGLGRLLLWDALERCLRVSNEMGIFAVEVHAIDSMARDFYQHFGFQPLDDHDLHLYLPIDSLKSLIGESPTT